MNCLMAFIYVVMPLILVLYYSSSILFSSARKDLMLMYILRLALTITYFLLADMDQYFAKDFTHVTSHCWFPKSECSVSWKMVLRPCGTCLG